MPEPISVVGVHGDRVPSPEGREALEAAALVVGGRRHLDALAPAHARRLAIASDLETVMDAVAAEAGRVCVLASGDPGFFGVVRPLAERFGAGRLRVWPAPSSVATAFARVGLPWDDAVVVSAHGRPLEAAVAAARGRDKVAVLVSPDNPPEAVGRALARSGARPARLVVCEHLGLASERVTETDLDGLAGGCWDPLSVVIVLAGGPSGAGAGVATSPSLAWGLPDAGFEHRAGMITKSEVRAVVLGKLDLPVRGVLWDVGAGSGSVAVEAKRLAPGMAVYAVERRPDDAERIRLNCRRHGVDVHVVEGTAPAALGDLPRPDRVFAGGGGLEVMGAAFRRLAGGGRLVATYAAVDRAAAAAAMLGHLVQVAVSRGERLPDGGLRLAADNPVFVAWGPGA